MFIATELYSTFRDLKQNNWWFDIGDLLGDLTKTLMTRHWTASLINFRTDFFSFALNLFHVSIAIAKERRPKYYILYNHATYTYRKLVNLKKIGWSQLHKILRFFVCFVSFYFLTTKLLVMFTISDILMTLFWKRFRNVKYNW